MSVDPLRHLSVFSPHKFNTAGNRVDIIGCGATGSRVALGVAKLGVENIHVWDFDTVESHNIANQVFGYPHVGLKKVEALRSLIQEQTEVEVTVHDEEVDGTQALGNIVFLLTDTMSSRKKIFEDAIKFKPNVALMIETRMGADNGRVYTVQPFRPGHVKAWEAAWYPDAEAEVSACGSSVTVGPTAEIIAGVATWQMIRWFGLEIGGTTPDCQLENEIILGFRGSTVGIGNSFRM